MRNFQTVPEIDLSPLWDKSEKGLKIVAKEVKEIFTTVGFAYLVNHQISDKVMNDIFSASKFFHALPLEEKMKIKQNKSFRGYVPIIPSKKDGSKNHNQNDAFVITYEVPEDHPDFINGTYLAGPNQWPAGMLEFKQTVCEYRNHMLDLARRLVTVFSTALDLGQNGLDEFFYNPTYVLRLQHYPEQPPIIPEKLYGLAPHTDYGLFTILTQDGVDGLEVKCENGEWLNVPSKPNSLVLNSGDIIKRWSNNIFKSNPHRVVNRSGKERYSIPFFFEPNMHTTIQVLTNYINEDNPAKYSPIKYGDYLVDRLQGDFGPLSDL